MHTEHIEIRVDWYVIGEKSDVTWAAACKIASDYRKQEGSLAGCPRFYDIIDGTEIPAVILANAIN